MRERKRDNNLKAQRRKILSDAAGKFAAMRGIDLKKVAEIDAEFQKNYEAILPGIQEEHVEKSIEIAREQKLALDRRLSDVKAQGYYAPADRWITGAQSICWYNFVKDYLVASTCNFTDDIDVNIPSKATIACDLVLSENMTKPYVMLQGGGDGVENRADLDSYVAFNLNDADFTSTGHYRFTPTILINGYWLKENWEGCEGVASSGTISVTLNLVATQLGGSKILAEKAVTVFEWTAGSSFTGALDKVYNLTGYPTSQTLHLEADVNPADGDVFVKASLNIHTSMTGLGRYLVDLKNSSTFYFKVVEIELSKRTCLSPTCRIGGPDHEVHCVVGGPDSPVICRIGGPDHEVHCVVGGPDSPVICRIGGPISEIHCAIGGPDNPITCAIGGPDIGIPDSCKAGPDYDFEFDPGIYESGVIQVDLAKVPQSMKRAFTKMLQRMGTK